MSTLAVYSKAQNAGTAYVLRRSSVYEYSTALGLVLVLAFVWIWTDSTVHWIDWTEAAKRQGQEAGRGGGRGAGQSNINISRTHTLAEVREEERWITLW